MGQPAEPTMGGLSPQTPPLAEWWKRAVAAIIDGVIVSVPSYIIMAIFSLGVSRRAEDAFRIDPSTGQVTSVDGGFFAGMFGGLIISFLIVTVLGIVYYVYFWGGEKGQTPGKMAMRVRVVDADTGGPIGYGRAFVRWIVIGVLWTLCYIPGIVDALFPLWDARRQTLHDKAAKSLVVDVL